LLVRVVVIDGLLKVQVGEWTTYTGHREPKQDEDAWIAWDTITTFPLVLNPHDHRLPPRLLLLDRYPDLTLFRWTLEYRRVLTAEQWRSPRFANEFQRWLKREDFSRIGGEEPPLFRGWENRFLTISFHHTYLDGLHELLSD